MYVPLVPYTLDPLARLESARDLSKFSGDAAIALYGALQHVSALPAYEPALVLGSNYDVLEQLASAYKVAPKKDSLELSDID